MTEIPAAKELVQEESPSQTALSLQATGRRKESVAQVRLLSGSGEAEVNGKPLTELLKGEEIEALVKRTRHGGAEIVNLLKQGSAYYAPGASVVEMVRMILRDEKGILPCSALLEGEYDIQGIFCGVPCRLGRKGILEIVELELTDEEKKALLRSAENVRKGVQELSSVLSPTIPS